MEICLYTKASVWKKTDCVGWAGADPPTCKMGTLYLMYRVSNLKLEFLYGLLWRYGKCYDFGLLVCYTTDLRQFFGAKNPTGSDRK